jgi:hypothetical protein
MVPDCSSMRLSSQESQGETSQTMTFSQYHLIAMGLVSYYPILVKKDDLDTAVLDISWRNF